MQYGFFYDQSRCIGCNACTIACKDYNQVNPGPVRWRDQRSYEGEISPFENLSMSCNHCADPACLKVCKLDAITKTDKGIVLVDRTKCQRLRLCLKACPFAAPQLADDQQEPKKLEAWRVTHPAQKCTYCWQRVEAGGAPSCVGACPVYALDFGDITDLEKRYPDAERVNPDNFKYAYKNNTANTKPSFLIRKRRGFTVEELSLE